MTQKMARCGLTRQRPARLDLCRIAVMICAIYIPKLPCRLHTVRICGSLYVASTPTCGIEK